MNNILLIDSSYRDRKLYPHNTSFILPVNTVQSSTEYIEVPIIFFRWAFPTNTVSGTMIGGSRNTIILSSEFERPLHNYFTGCILKFLDTSSVVMESSRIVGYDPSTNTVVLDNAVSNATLTATSTLIVEYFDSVTYPSSIQITGYVNGVISEYNNLFVYNRTKNLIFEIASLDAYGFVTLSQSMGTTYDINDDFEIRLNRNHYKITTGTYYVSIYSYVINEAVPSAHEYRFGEILHALDPTGTSIIDVPQLYEVVSTDPFDIQLVSYGGNYLLGGEYRLVPEDHIDDVEYYQKCFILSCMEVALACNSLGPAIPDPSNNVLYIGNYRFGSLVFFQYEVFEDVWIVLTDINQYIDIALDYYDDGTILDVFFLTKSVQTISLNVANTSIPQNPPCCQVRLVSLILPNKIVRGYNQLLSFFPYVIVKLYNTSSPFKTKNYSVITNNPVSAVSQFLCPIGNLLNPSIIRFVEIASDMTQAMVINPYDDLLFEVTLPDGTILQYDESVAVTSNIQYLVNYSTILQNRLDFTFYNTVCAIFSLKTL